MRIELTKNQEESLINFLSKMNYYEIMAMLSKSYDNVSEMENARKDILSVYNKLVNNSDGVII